MKQPCFEKTNTLHTIYNLLYSYYDIRVKRAMLRRAVRNANTRKQPLTFDDQGLRELRSNEAIRIISWVKRYFDASD